MTTGAQRIASLAVGLSILTAPLASAHSDAPAWGSGAESWLVPMLVLAVAWYVRGLYNLHSAAMHFAHMKRLAICFALGWAAIAIALVSPLALESAGIYSAHMLQHELLMVVGAPLMVLGRPLAIWTWALPARSRVAAVRPFRQPVVSIAWSCLSTPLVATLLHAAAIWVWHVPHVFERAQSSTILHALQHSAFLFTALLFWWVLLKPGGEQRTGTALLCLFITMLHTTLLGVLLTFSDAVWYPAGTARAAHWGLTALEDQQLGGLIMWVPGAVPYIIAALALATRWFSADPQRGPDATLNV